MSANSRISWNFFPKKYLSRCLHCQYCSCFLAVCTYSLDFNAEHVPVHLCMRQCARNTLQSYLLVRSIELSSCASLSVKDSVLSGSLSECYTDDRLASCLELLISWPFGTYGLACRGFSMPWWWTKAQQRRTWIRCFSRQTITSISANHWVKQVHLSRNWIDFYRICCKRYKTTRFGIFESTDLNLLTCAHDHRQQLVSLLNRFFHIHWNISTLVHSAGSTEKPYRPTHAETTHGAGRIGSSSWRSEEDVTPWRWI